MNNKINTEFFEHTIRQWTENLWRLNHQAQITDEASRRAVFDQLHSFIRDNSNNNRGLTRLQSLSEQGFTALCIGASHVPVKKVGELIAGNGLTDAWRRTVLRNSFQQHYALFTTCVKEGIDKFGAAVVAAQFPQNALDTEAMLQTLKYMSFKPGAVDTSVVEDLIKRAGGGAPKTQAPKL